MATERIEQLLALVLLEQAETQSVCLELRALLRGNPLERDDELEASLRDLRGADMKERLERYVAVMKSLDLEETMEWAMRQRTGD